MDKEEERGRTDIRCVIKCVLVVLSFVKLGG